MAVRVPRQQAWHQITAMTIQAGVHAAAKAPIRFRACIGTMNCRPASDRRKTADDSLSPIGLAALPRRRSGWERAGVRAPFSLGSWVAFSVAERCIGAMNRQVVLVIQILIESA